MDHMDLDVTQKDGPRVHRFQSMLSPVASIGHFCGFGLQAQGVHPDVPTNSLSKNMRIKGQSDS